MDWYDRQYVTVLYHSATGARTVQWFRVRLWRDGEVLWEDVAPWGPSAYEYRQVTDDKALGGDEYFSLECILDASALAQPAEI